MIWDGDAGSKSGDSAVVRHIKQQVRMVCGGDFLLDPEAVEELARAVEMYLQENSSGNAVESRYLISLIARALSSIGERRAARRLFLFGTGLVAPAEWEVTGNKAVWILDLRHMTIWGDAALELVFFRNLNAAVEGIADVWDASSGGGVLGLRHVFRAAFGLAGSGCVRSDAVSIAGEIKGRCTRKLEQIARMRGWIETPRVMNLDVN